MPLMPNDKLPLNTIEVAKQLAEKLQSRGQEYALGAQSPWDIGVRLVARSMLILTLFCRPKSSPIACGCFKTSAVNFRRTQCFPVAVRTRFLPRNFLGKGRGCFFANDTVLQKPLARRKVDLDGQPIMVWDAESLAVFKMMFFRRKDLADVEQILRAAELEI